MIYLCVGRRELGKTTLALYLTRSVRPRVIFDPRGLVPADGGRASTPDQIEDRFTRLYEQSEQNRSDIVITPDRDTQAAFAKACGEVKTWLQTGAAIGFIVDESTFVDMEIDQFDWIIRCAPRRTATIVLTQHRPFDIPIRIRSIVDMWCVFRTTEPRDLKVIAERCTESFAKQVERLRPREFLVWDDTQVDQNVRACLDPAAWYVPLLDSQSSGVAAGGRVELPAGNASVQKKVDLFTHEP